MFYSPTPLKIGQFFFDFCPKAEPNTSLVLGTHKSEIHS